MNSSSLSDREKARLRGPVKTIVDDYSTTGFDRSGKTLSWSGNTSHGRVERTYVYDERERLVRVTGSDGGHHDEFRYEDQGKAQIRHIPARPDQQPHAFGISALFEVICEGEALTDGGTVETTYNERDQPIEKRVFDDQGTQLYRVEYFYDTNARLSTEKLISENPAFPRAFRDQIPMEQRAAVLAEMKTNFEEITQRTGLLGTAERAYVYNAQGRIAERHMRMGSIREELTFSYNEHGDISELTIEMSGFPEDGVETQSILKCRRVYEYDSFGNWTSMNEASGFGENATTRTQIRHLTYHQ